MMSNMPLMRQIVILCNDGLSSSPEPRFESPPSVCSPYTFFGNVVSPELLLPSLRPTAVECSTCGSQISSGTSPLGRSAPPANASITKQKRGSRTRMFGRSIRTRNQLFTRRRAAIAHALTEMALGRGGIPSNWRDRQPMPTVGMAPTLAQQPRTTVMSLYRGAKKRK